jgi:hypothetical protein
MIFRTLLDLSDAELATASRPTAHQDGERARKLEHPMMRAPVDEIARLYAALVRRLRTHRTARK